MGWRMRARLMVEQQEMALRLRAAGWSLAAAGAQAGCTSGKVWQLLRPPPVTLTARRQAQRSLGWVPGPGRLTLADREEITLGLHGGEPFTVIAARLGRACSTVSRGGAGNGGRGGDRGWRAHEGGPGGGRRAEREG